MFSDDGCWPSKGETSFRYWWSRRERTSFMADFITRKSSAIPRESSASVSTVISTCHLCPRIRSQLPAPSRASPRPGCAAGDLPLPLLLVHVDEHRYALIEEIPDQEPPRRVVPDLARGNILRTGGGTGLHDGVRPGCRLLQVRVVDRSELQFLLFLDDEDVRDHPVPGPGEGERDRLIPREGPAPPQTRLPGDVGQEDHLAVHDRRHRLVEPVLPRPSLLRVAGGKGNRGKDPPGKQYQREQFHGSISKERWGAGAGGGRGESQNAGR